jgi:DNA-3-methyladenine glycosylase II
LNSQPFTGFDVAIATRAVAEADPVMAAFMERAGPFVPRAGSPDSFQALVRSILYQQLAGSAAAAIHARFVDTLGGRVTPEAIRDCDPAAMRAAGLSGAKAAAVTDLAARVLDGTVPLDDAPRLDDADIIRRLCTVRGIGTWTAEMFLMFQLQRPDVWPVGDLGVRQGYRLIYGMEAMPTPRELGTAGERFRPYRSLAAWYCWEAVHIARSA